MQLVPIKYSNGRKTFQQVMRNGDAVIYKCTDGKVGYEVHQIRIEAPCEYMGKQLPEREILANNKEWGEFGWSYKQCSPGSRAPGGNHGARKLTNSAMKVPNERHQS